jgi:hypothetical protein
MSDGPFKALKARPHWNDFFKSLENSASSDDERKMNHDVASSRDFDEVPYGKIRDILRGPAQLSLLPDAVERLEALRVDHPGSAATDAAINCAIDQVRNGATGETAFNAAMQDALKEIQQNEFRGAREHLQRKVSSQEKEILGRLNAIGEKTAFEKLAADLCGDNPTHTKTSRVPKQTGLNQGPPLP